MNNIIIVESKNDQIFIDALIKHLNIGTEINTQIIINEYATLDGLSKTTLINKLKSIKASNVKKPVNKLGILIDLDNYDKKQRLEFINECIQEVFTTGITLNNINELAAVSTPTNTINIATYFTNVNGKGELETLLKVIKNQDSSYADCLESWRECVSSKNKTIKQKDFDKFWINIYIRYDTCSRKESKRAGEKCSMSNFEYIMTNKTFIWDFEHENLQELKEFLLLFS